MSTSGVTRSSRLKVSNDEPLVSTSPAFSKPTGEASAGNTVELTEDLGEGLESEVREMHFFADQTNET